MGPAARSAGPLLLRVQPTESGQSHAEKRCRVEVFDSIPPSAGGPAVAQLQARPVDRQSFRATGAIRNDTRPIAFGTIRKGKRLWCEAPARIRTEKVPSRGSADDRCLAADHRCVVAKGRGIVPHVAAPIQSPPRPARISFHCNAVQHPMRYTRGQACYF